MHFSSPFFFIFMVKFSLIEVKAGKSRIWKIKNPFLKPSHLLAPLYHSHHSVGTFSHGSKQRAVSDLPCVWVGLWGRQADPLAVCANSYCWTTWGKRWIGIRWKKEMAKAQQRQTERAAGDSLMTFHIWFTICHSCASGLWLPVMPDIFDSILGVP